MYYVIYEEYTTDGGYGTGRWDDLDRGYGTGRWETKFEKFMTVVKSKELINNIKEGADKRLVAGPLIKLLY